VRQGFNASLRAMQALGVRVAPYINGRIFDKATHRSLHTLSPHPPLTPSPAQATASWSADHAVAQASAAKQAKAALGADQLSFYEEQYGSKAKFAVMCPHTDYWQRTIAGVVEELTGAFGTDGVYIDQALATHAARTCCSHLLFTPSVHTCYSHVCIGQIAAAGPKPCWDRSHNHSLGGGSHWVSGCCD